MSSNYTHFDQIAFDKLFGRKPSGQEIQVMDAAGNLSGIGNINTTGSLSVTSVTATSTVTGSNLSGTNTGDVTLGTANGLSLSGQQLSLAAASSSAAGVLSTGVQNIAGNKTFKGSISASNLSGSNTGDVTIGTANGLSLTGQQLSVGAASSSAIGVVTTGAQNFGGNKTFKGSISASNLSGTNTGDQTITLSSDVSGSGTGAITATVNSVGGSTASNIHAAEQLANAATNANTANAIVKRDSSGNFLTNAVYTPLDVKYFGAKGDGTTDDTTAIQNALNAMSAGSSLFFPPGTYKVSSDLTIGVGQVKIFGSGKTSKIVLADGKKISSSGHSDIEVSSIWIDGTNYATGTSSGNLLKITGTTASSRVSNIFVHDCYFSNATFYGIYIEFATDVRVSNNYLTNIYYSAINFQTVTRVAANHNIITNILGNSSGNSYGITFTHAQDQPVCTECTAIGNLIENNTSWEALDTHGGTDIVFANNVIKSCNKGIGVGRSQNTGTITAPLRVVISNNVFEADSAGSNNDFAISITGYSTVVGTTISSADSCVITGNSFYGWGLDNSSLSSTIVAHDTHGLVITDNTFNQPCVWAIMMYYANHAFVIENNVCIDPWSNTFSTTGFCLFDDDFQDGIIANNVITTQSKSATNVMTCGIRFFNTATAQNIYVGPHYYSGSDSTLQTNLPSSVRTWGQVVDSLQNTAVNATSTGNFFDVTSITLTPGDWELTGCVSFALNGATASLYCEAGIGTASGTSGTGLVLNQTWIRVPLVPTSSEGLSMTLPTSRVNISSSTTYYLKGQINYSAGTPTATGYIKARRIR